MLKPGMRVRYKDGSDFGNGQKIATISKVSSGGYLYDEKVWFYEVPGWALTRSVEVVNDGEGKIEKLKSYTQALIDEKQKEIKNLEDDIKKLNYIFVTLGELND